MMCMKRIATGCAAAAGLAALTACAPYGLISGDWQERQPQVVGGGPAVTTSPATTETTTAAVPATAAGMHQFSAALSGANEVPMNFSPANGAAAAVYDPSTRTLSWTVTYGGLTGDVSAAHFHGPAAEGENGGVQLNIGANGLASPLTGSATLTDEQASQLIGGLWYINVHSTVNPDGEIRGQVRPTM